MPHSPYTTTVHPPMRDGDLLQYEADLHAHRQRLENGESDKVAEEGLLENSEVLLEHCRFLDDKLIIRSRTIRRLETTVDDVTTECRDLRDRVQAQDAEIQDLRTQLEAARRAADLKKMEAEEDAAWSKIIDDALAEKTEEDSDDGLPDRSDTITVGEPTRSDGSKRRKLVRGGRSS